MTRYTRFALVFLLVLSLPLVYSCSDYGQSSLEKAKNFLENGKINLAENILRKLTRSQPTQFENWFTLGRVQFRTGNYNGAIYSFQSALEVNQTDTEALIYLSRSYFQNNQTARAFESINRALEASEKKAIPLLRKAEMYEVMGEDQKALETFQEAYNIDGKNPDILSSYGRFHLNRGNLTQARKLITRALNSYESDTPARFYSLSGRLARARGMPKREFKSLKKAVRLNENLVGAQLNLARLMEARGDTSSANVKYQSLLENHFSVASVHRQYGLFQLRQNNLGDALDHFNWVIRINPSSPEGFYYQGITLERMNQPTQALESYRQALEQDPRHVPSLNNAGLIALNNDRAQQALELFNRTLEIRPGYLRGLFNSALAYRRLDEKEKASDRLKLVLERTQENSTLHQRAQSLLDKISS